jgi:hypothetical protein
LTGIKHHTLAVGSGKIPWASYNEEHDAGAIADVLTDHDKAAHDALDIDADTLDGHDSAYFAVAGSVEATTLDGLDSADFVKVEDHTQSAHNDLDIDAATLDGSTKAQVQTHAPAEHGNEVHTSTYVTADDVPSAINGKDGAGFVANMLTLWDKTLGDIPENFMEIQDLTGTNFTIIKYVGGEKLTNVTHSITVVAGATVTITPFNSEGVPLFGITITNGTFTPALVYPNDQPIKFGFAKSDATDADYNITAIDPDTGTKCIDINVTVPGEDSTLVTLILPKACNITIEED